MKKQHFFIPATLTAFSSEEEAENKRFTRCKLKVFYVGMTADKRLFTESFSADALKTLPLCPVVAYYDKEKEDFVGHATEQQILGVVDPTVEPTFEKDENDGNTWAVCDVVLYTERPDQVGEIAKKVVGKSQSLELNPATLKYKINYDEKKHFKNLEFTAGEIIGLSVLGDDQKPAFTGSAFFSCFTDEDFANKMTMLKNYCESEAEKRTNNMKKSATNFIELAYGEQMQKVSDAFNQEYCNDGCSYLVDAFQSYAIMRIYYYADGSTKLLKVNYSIDDNGVVSLGDVKEVRVTYEEIPTPDGSMAVKEPQPKKPHCENEGDAKKKQSCESEGDAKKKQSCEDEGDAKKKQQCENEDLKKKQQCEEEDLKKKQQCEEGDAKKKQQCESDNADAKKKQQCDTDENSEAKKKQQCEDGNSEAKKKQECEVTPKEDQKRKRTCSTEGENNANNDLNFAQTENTDGVASLSKSEREELEALRKEVKVNLIKSFSDRLPAELVDSFMAKLDSYKTEKDLKFEILEALESNRKVQTENGKYAPFSLSDNSSNTDNFAQYIRRNLK